MVAAARAMAIAGPGGLGPGGLPGLRSAAGRPMGVAMRTPALLVRCSLTFPAAAACTLDGAGLTWRRPAQVRRRGHSCVAAAAGAGGGAPPVKTSRRLVLLRHGESEPRGASAYTDHQRPLSAGGRAAVRKLAQELDRRGDGWLPELILCSDSQRTRETLELMVEEVGAFGDATTLFLGSLYTCAAMDGETRRQLSWEVSKVAGEGKVVFCMGHNKGWEEAASEFSGQIVSLEEANAALLESATGETWEEALDGEWGLVDVVQP